ncbi:MAG: general stress protein [Gemmatimonadales bacterium]|nr:general stress protein [Gemmatimonadales bacterium]
MDMQSNAGSRTTSTVVGLFHDRDDAERAVRALRDAGFSDSAIGIAMRDADQQQELSESTGTSGEGVKKGAVSGGVVGGLAGLLGSLLIPGLGPIVVAGWLGSTLVGAGIGAAAGGLIGGLVDLGVSEDEAHHFERGVHGGGILVTVNAGARAHAAYEILHDAGADLGPETAAGWNAGETIGEASMEGAARTDRSANVDRSATENRSMQAQRLQLREDQLRAMTERAQTGEARLRKQTQAEASFRVDRSGSDAESWRGNERRFQDDARYSGPERRVAMR